MPADYPKFDGFSLQDDNYITSNMEYRTIPKRSIETEKLARKPGVKLLSNDFAERTVRLSGTIIASNVDELKNKIDNFHTNVTRKEEGSLEIVPGRSATAIVSNVTITEPQYSQDFVPFEVEFLLPDPFFYEEQHTVSWTIASGTASTTKTITISGSVFAEPIIKYFAPSGTGQTTTSGIIIQYIPTGEIVTWSGTTTPTLAYGSDVTFDYANHKILEGTEEANVEGVFSRWEPGLTDFKVTFSGTADGGTLDFYYQPRYL